MLKTKVKQNVRYMLSQCVAVAHGAVCCCSVLQHVAVALDFVTKVL